MRREAGERGLRDKHDEAIQYSIEQKGHFSTKFQQKDKREIQPDQNSAVTMFNNRKAPSSKTICIR